MKIVGVILIFVVMLIGCGSSSETAPSQTGSGAPKVMPGGPGVTSGQSGTGTTAGGSTGY
ncbi:MAG: hypothetical protein ACHQ50_08405 [Fimbriimonadales bacterium]